MAAPWASSHPLLHHFSRSQPPASFVSFLTPLLFSPTTPSGALSKSFLLLRKPLFPSLFPLPSPPPLFSHSLSSSPFTISLTTSPEKPFLKDDDGTEQFGEEIENGLRETHLGDTQKGVDPASSPLKGNEKKAGLKLPNLTVKEKKELASYAHSLGKKLKLQLVGKSGVTPNVASSFIETLEANELLKIKIHPTCPGELDEVVKQLEEATASVVVGQIGRTVIIYKPSLMKLKSEEKKKQAHKVFVRKQSRPNPMLPSKEEVSRPSRRGQRGSSRL